MPRRLARRPFEASPGSRIEFNEQNWIDVQQMYGCRVPKAARDKIVDATNQFIAFAAAERHALPIKAVNKKIGQIGRAARVLLSELEIPQDNSAAVAAADLLGQKSVDLDGLHGLVAVLEATCDHLGVDLKSRTPHYEGSAWAQWIGELTRAVRNHNLPSGARKDSDKRASDSPSQFVRLVQALQSFVPHSYRRHSQSPNALATAIALARNGRRVK